MTKQGRRSSASEQALFQVLHLAQAERLVVGVVNLEARVRATGKTLRETGEAHLWHFDERGLVVRFRHAADTYGHVQAWTR